MLLRDSGAGIVFTPRSLSIKVLPSSGPVLALFADEKSVLTSSWNESFDDMVLDGLSLGGTPGRGFSFEDVYLDGTFLWPLPGWFSVGGALPTTGGMFPGSLFPLELLVMG
jgi:hypothetical protein